MLVLKDNNSHDFRFLPANSANLRTAVEDKFQGLRDAVIVLGVKFNVTHDQQHDSLDGANHKSYAETAHDENGESSRK
jgi:hypothetical protein